MTAQNESYLNIGDATIDLDREERCGFSEVIYGESKTADAIERIALAQIERNIDVLATRVSQEKANAILPSLRRARREAYYNPVGRVIRIPSPRRPEAMYQGRIGIVTAGTSDLPVAEEARETAAWTGAMVEMIQDVGVAGPQRLVAHVPRLREMDALIVVAGMEGALPSVVGGYVSAPIIAVPTSVGYGASFGGVAALLGMINSCASNVTVVNIDAGFKAGYVAGLIAKNIAGAAEDGYYEGVNESRARASRRGRIGRRE